MTARDTRRITGPRLPSSRALVGGMLVVASAAGVLVAHRSATAPPDARHVVVTHDVAAGATLRSQDLGTVAVDLPAGVRSVPEERADELIGRVTRTGIQELALVRPADVYEEGRFAGDAAVELAVDLPPAPALAGTIVAGSIVDVLSTDTGGTGTSTVAEQVRVTGIDDDAADRSIGGGGALRVRLGLADVATAQAVVDAAVRTELSLILPAPAVRSDRP